MDYLSSIIYGIIQGLTEFLPVSSSGHLALLPYFLKISDPGVVFDLAMHVGTALAVIVYFYREILLLFKEFINVITFKTKNLNSCAYLLNMIISTVIAIFLALTLKDLALSFGRSVNLIAYNLIFFGILMFLADWLGKEDSNVQMNRHFQWKKALMIGIFQAFAVFPGVSRSGATLTISRFMGLSRNEATRYSFLLSLPIIIGGFVYKLPELFKSNSAFDLSNCLMGMFISFLVGIVTIHFFLKIIKKVGLLVFSVYRIILAVVVLYLLG